MMAPTGRAAAAGKDRLAGARATSRSSTHSSSAFDPGRRNDPEYQTRSPGANIEALSPTSRTTPAASQPSTTGSPRTGRAVARTQASTGSTEIARTSTSRSRGPGRGSGSSRSSSASG